MNGIFLPSLYVMSGVCAYASLHHWLAVLRRRVSRIDILFALMSLLAAGLIFARAGAYSAQNVNELVLMRRWEVSFACLFVPLFVWLVAEYTDSRPRKLLAGMTVFWALLFFINLALPYGIQFRDLPRLSYLQLPWGENVVDLRVLQRSFWHNLMWVGILIALGYALYACYAYYRKGHHQKAVGLAWGLAVFSAFILFNAVINFGNINFFHTSDFAFISLIVLMDLKMFAESRDQYRRMSAVLDHMPVAICLKDLQGRFQLVNREFEEFFRVNNTELQNKTVFALFPRDKAEIFHANDLLAIELRKEIESEEVLEHDGDLRTLKSNRFPLLRPDGNPYAVVGIFVDITESRQKDVALSMLRRQVWHTDRVLSTGAIAGSLAHELSQPLSAILNNAQAGLRFMNSERIDLDEIREILHDIVRDDKRAGAVINGLRSMLQQRESPFAIVDLAQCIEEVIEILHSEFVRLSIVVEQKLESKLSIYADKTQIQQVILNLIVNALEAMAMQETDARTLRIIASHDDGKVVISVRDSGTGIPEDKLDRIFEGFFTTKPQGLGVGLEVCRSIIKSHRGKIWAENNKDQGATFHIILPIAPEAETPADPAYA